MSMVSTTLRVRASMISKTRLPLVAETSRRRPFLERHVVGSVAVDRGSPADLSGLEIDVHHIGE